MTLLDEPRDHTRDDIVLQAFLLALPQLDGMLPEPIQTATQQIGRWVEARQPELAVKEIRAIVQQDPRLHKLYEACYDQLNEHYQSQERLKSLDGASALTLNWQQQMLVPILTADHPRNAARAVAKRAVAQTSRRDTLSPNGVFLTSLLKTVQKVSAQESALLSALEYHPSTLEDLTYAVGMPMEQVGAIAQSLWDANDITPVTTPLWQRLFPKLKSRSGKPRNLDQTEYLTLTPKGRSRLYPLVATSGDTE